MRKSYKVIIEELKILYPWATVFYFRYTDSKYSKWGYFYQGPWFYFKNAQDLRRAMARHDLEIQWFLHLSLPDMPASHQAGTAR